MLAMPALQPTTTHFDYPGALDRCCGDEEFLAEMVDLLASSVATQLAAINAAAAMRSPDELRHAAHALKGAVASMTSARPYELVRELEWLGKSGTCHHADALIAELRVSLDQLLNEMRWWSDHRATCHSL